MTFTKATKTNTVERKSIFNAGFKDAQPRGARGNYLTGKTEIVNGQEIKTSASYVCRVNRCGVVTAEESKKGRESFFAELEVVTSNNPEIGEGYIASWVTHEGSFYYIEDVKEFVCAALNGDPKEVDESDLADVVSDEKQAAAGKLLHVTVKEIETKKGGAFTKHIFSSHKE